MCNILCASQITESAWSMPARRPRKSGLTSRPPPCAASTCSQMPRSRVMAAISGKGSKAPIGVAHAEATTAITVRPSARARSSAEANASGRMRRAPSTGILMMLSVPRPRTPAARATL